MKELTIISCIKQIPDPEGPSSAYQVDTEAKQVRPVGIPPVMNPFDENALEAALRIKERVGGRIVAMSMVEKTATPVLKKALAVGADELVFLQDEHFKDLDSSSTASVLSAAIEKLGSYDLVLCGRQAADWNCGQVGSIMAEMLHIPSINLAQGVEVHDSNVVVKTLKRSGYGVIRASMPALIIASSEIGELRLPSIQAIKDARKKPTITLNSGDLNVDPASLETKKIYSLVPLPSRKRDCVFIEGENATEKGEMLAFKLRQDGVI